MSRIPFILFVLFLIPLISHAQWEKLPGPYGGPISAMTDTDDGTLYAANGRGAMYASTDQGASWRIASTDHNLYLTRRLDQAPDGMLYLATNSRVFRSTDGGTWEATAFTQYPVTIGFTANGDLLVGGRGGVFRSHDNGDSFSTFEPVPETTRQFKVTITDNGTWLAGAYRESVYRSTDEGASWIDVGASLPNNEIYSLSTIDGSTVFAGLNATTYFTTDLGDSWEQVSGMQGANIYAVHRLNTTRLAAEGTGGLYYSSDDGRNWTRSNHDSTRMGLSTFHQAAWGDLYAATMNSLLRSTDLGSTWQCSETGIFIPSLFDVIAFGSEKYLVITNHAHRSTDAGQTWMYADTAYDPFLARATLLADDGSIYISTDDCYLRRSDDDGQTWSVRLGPDDGYEINSLTETEEGLLATIVNSDVFLSTDRGESWEQLSTLPQGPASLGQILADNADASTIYSANIRGFARSTDGGETWEELLVDGQTRTLTRMHQSPAGTLFVLGNREWYYSTDRGDTWSIAHEYTDQQPVPVIASNSKSNVFIADEQGLLRSEDGTGGWTRVAFEHGIETLTMDDDDYILVGTTHHGIFRSSMTTVGTGELAAAPRSLRIDGVYPQPLRTDVSAMVRISLQHPSALRLQLFDVLGSVVYESDAGTIGSGTHDLRLDAAGLAPGTYTLRVHAGGKSTMRQVVIVR